MLVIKCYLVCGKTSQHTYISIYDSKAWYFIAKLHIIYLYLKKLQNKSTYFLTCTYYTFRYEPLSSQRGPVLQNH